MHRKILNFIDFNRINTLLEGFNKTTGFVTAILDLSGNVLSKSGWRNICTDFHRINALTAKKCTISDTELANKMASGEKYHFYKCLNGLVDVAVPLVINGEHIANLFSGQFFFEEPDRDLFLEQATKYGFDNEKYMKALADVPVISEERVKTAMDFLLDMTKMIAEMTLHRMEQNHLNEKIHETKLQLKAQNKELIVAKESAEASEKYLSSILNNMGDPVFVKDDQSRILLVNDAFCSLFELSRDQIIGKTLAEDVTPEERESFLRIDKQVIADGKENINIETITIRAGQSQTISTRKSRFIGSDGHKFLVGAIRDITERKHAEEALIQSEQQNRTILQTALDGFWIVDLQGRFTEVNEAYCRLTSYCREELLTMSVSDVEVMDTEADVRQRIQRLTQKGSDRFETKHRCKDGRIVDIEVSINFLKEKQLFFVFLHDITERKQAEEKLRDSETRFRKIYEDGAFGMVLVNKDFKFLMANKTFCQMTGYQEEEIQQLTFPHITHPDDIAKDIQNVKKLISGETNAYRTEKRYLKKDGQIFWAHLTVFPMCGLDGMFLYNVGIIVDTSEHKKAEEALHQEQLLYIDLVNTLPSGMYRLRLKPMRNLSNYNWRSHVESDYSVDFVSDRFCEITGISRKEFMANLGIIPDRIHPDDSADFVQMNTKAVLSTTPFTWEGRMITPDKGTIWIHFESLPRLQENGEMVCTGVIQNITERKQAEFSLNNLADNYRLLTSTTTDGFWIVDKVGKIIEANDECCKMYNYSREELIGLSIQDFEATRDPDKTQKHINEILESGFARFETKHYTKSGITLDIEVNTTYQQSTETFHTFLRNITERKRTEKKLRENNSRLELAMKVANMAWWQMELPSGKVIFDNRKAEMLGYSPTEFSHYTDFTKLIHPDDYENAMNTMRQHINGELDKYEIEYRILTKTGNYKWLYDIGSIIKLAVEEKRMIITGLVIDISERKQADSILHEIIEKNPISIQMIDSEGYTLQTNAAHTRLFGAVPPPDYSIFKDEQILNQGFVELLEGVKAGESARFPDFTFNIHDVYPELPDNPIWLRLVIFPLMDKEGNLERYVLMHEDITERKKAEIALQASEEKYKQIFDNTFDIMSIYEVTEDHRYKIITFNPAEAKLIGGIENYQNKYIDECISPELYKVFSQNYERCIKAGCRIEYEEDISFLDIIKL